MLRIRETLDLDIYFSLTPKKGLESNISVKLLMSLYILLEEFNITKNSKSLNTRESSDMHTHIQFALGKFTSSVNAFSFD